jgi:CHAD domain-containing protein
MTVGPPLASTYAAVGPFLAARLRALDELLRDVAPRVVAAGDDEAVHDVRVALRRTRTALEAGRPVLGRFHADEVRRALREVMQATGALRDEEVLLELIGSLGVEREDVTAWLETRRTRERRLRGAVVRTVREGALDRGRELLGALLAFRVDPKRERRLSKFARRAVERARREVERRRDARLDDANALHDLRIAYKRLRYTVETFADALPRDLAALAHPAARLQGKLGDLHDVDVAVACVRRARTLTDEGRAALLVALERERAARVAAYARELGIAYVSDAPLVVPPQPAGDDSLRKISTR